MKKKLYLLFVFAIATACVFFIVRKKPVKEFSLIERNGEMKASSEWLNTKAAMESLLTEIKLNPGNEKAKLTLAMAYISESRISGNHSYYDAAALQLLDEVLENDKDNFDARSARATIYLSQHHFSDALAEGQKLIEMNPHSAYAFGIMTDANLELGHYEEAKHYADKMVSLRPDLRSYSRISYLREVFGDYPGAIEAMKLAVESGIPGTEQTEWARTYVGYLYEITGNKMEAQHQYLNASYHRPYYAYALAGLGRIEKQNANYDEALHYFNLAKMSVTDYVFFDDCSDVYSRMMQSGKAKEELDKAVELLLPLSGNESQSAHGHYADRELALLYLKAYRYDLALKHANLEYDRRPDNIDVNQTLAWVHFRRGEYDDANKFIDVALKTNSQNAVLLMQAAMIKAKAGNVSLGKNLMEKSLSVNPNVAFELKYEAEKIIGIKLLATVK